MGAHKQCRRIGHGVQAQALGAARVAAPAVQEGVGHGVQVQVIGVRLAGRVPHVPVQRYLLYRDRPDVGRHQRVERAQQRRRALPPGAAELHHLAAGVHPGVGAPRSLHPQRLPALPRGPAQRLLHPQLHGGLGAPPLRRRLQLEAPVGGTIILQHRRVAVQRRRALRLPSPPR